MSTDTANDTIGYLHARIEALQNQIEILTFQKNTYRSYLNEYLDGNTPKGYDKVVREDLTKKGM